MIGTYRFKNNPFVLFVENAAPIFIVGSVLLVIFGNFLFPPTPMFHIIIILLGTIKGICALLKNQCYIEIKEDKIIFNKKQQKLTYTFNIDEIQNINYKYYGNYDIELKNQEIIQVNVCPDLTITEQSYLDCNVALYKLLKNKFSSQYTDELVLYSENNTFPECLAIYDKNIKLKRIFATILYTVFSLPIILITFITIIIF